MSPDLQRLRSAVLLLAASFFWVWAAPAAEQSGSDGAKLYVEHCAGCHGRNGDGKGSIAQDLNPRPRDFTKGRFKFATTLNGMPSDDDLVRIVAHGIRWSAMRPFGGVLPEEQIRAVALYVRKLSQFYDEAKRKYVNVFELRGPPKPLEVPVPPVPTQALVEQGRELFLGEEGGCVKCHGADGRGTGPSANELKDDWGQPIHPRNLTWPVYKMSNTPRDIYIRLKLGIPGTPMPSFGDSLMEDQIWALVFYVRSLRMWPEEITERGHLLYGALGCLQCHGPEGTGGYLNPNYIKKTVPALNTLAERLFLQDVQEAAVMIDLLRRGNDLETMKEEPEIARFPAAVAQYRSIRDVILKGSPAGKENPKGVSPPRHMPAWGAEISKADLNAILAYLLTLQPWETEEE